MQRIRTEEDVHLWKRSSGYQAFVAWIQKRAQRIVGKEIVQGDAAKQGCSDRIRKILLLLNTMEQWSDEVELYPGTQRFGNRAFRKYITLMEERLPTSLPTPPEITARILPLLLQSHAFGHPVRLDYGSGHELSFVLSLFVMVQMGYIGHLREGSEEAGDREAEEDDLVLRVFPRYLSLVTGLQKKYRLEPAGSHGVWGLDDFCFLPYLWGSAQLLGTDITPPEALEQARAAAKDPNVTVTDLWTISPLLNSLSTTMPNFRKIHKGLLKMYEEEVLGKRVVVQHLFLDEYTWGADIRSGTGLSAVNKGDMAAVPGKGNSDGMEATKAPWVR
ncbi:hypothetical protein QFC21_004157 [Naganishia friedmannii]|uniref:Uncharacterized protein n=1 Tax=Naganishia friedmannii TaxID=89922 RepID=A0ACC2VJJ3_9TREE|nr:hypothetical protein QFC21_004157 [Naganishia friedmannii]